MLENNENVLNNNVVTNSVNNGIPNLQAQTGNITSPATEPSITDTEDEKLRRELEEVGEHDIVIEEDFVINIDVAEVSDLGFSATSGDSSQSQVSNEPPVELASEQSGNITF